MRSSGQSKQRHLRWITTECLDVFLHPLEQQYLVMKSEIQHAFVGSNGRREETKGTDTVMVNWSRIYRNIPLTDS